MDLLVRAGQAMASVVKDSRLQMSSEGPSRLAVEKRVSLSWSQSGLMANLMSRWPLLAGFPGEKAPSPRPSCEQWVFAGKLELSEPIVWSDSASGGCF